MGVSREEINELRYKRGKLIDAGRAIVEKAKEEKRELSSEERANYNKMFDEQSALKADIEIREKQLALEGEASGESADIELRHKQLEAELRGGKAGEPPAPGDNVENRAKLAKEAMEKRAAEYRTNFGKFLRGDASPMEIRALQADLAVSGGYLVAPELLVAELIKNVDDEVLMRKYCRKQTLVKAASLGFPRLRTKMAAASWSTEITNADADSTLDFGKRAFFPHPLSALILVSEDLMRLSILDAEQIVREEQARVLGEKEENAFMTGDGQKKPLGIFTASDDGIDTSRDVSSGNSATAPGFDGLKRAKFALKPQYKKNAMWLFHPDVLLEISLIKDGQGRYIWQESQQVGEPDRLLGHGIIESRFAPSTLTASQYVGCFGDFSEYQIVDTLDMSMKKLDQLYALSNQVGFLSRNHVDGAPRKAEAFARVKLAAS